MKRRQDKVNEARVQGARRHARISAMTQLSPQEAEHYARDFVPLWAPRRPEPTVKLSTHPEDDFDDDIVVRGLGAGASSKKWIFIACGAALMVAVPLGISLLKSKEPAKSLCF